MYAIVYEKRVYKDLDRIPKEDLEKIAACFAELKQNPRKPGSQKLTDEPGRHRIRKGDYRIVYIIEEQTKTIKIILVRHRKDVYKKL